MSSEPVIQVKGLGKKYPIKSSQISNYRNLAEKIASWPRRLLLPNQDQKEFWALSNLNFSIYKGESIGIIGPNGSGKSTLLKILARVTWPTTGCVEIHGRVSALLEVGAGFHFELTGRENIYLGGAMLGMSRGEVSRHFDQIVDFSEIGTFLETPVKKYSSGMFLRLAFSVMVHLQGDILIIDEILAVGDSSFQEKCLKKMQSLVKEGRTIIFVSHQLEKIRFFCSKVLSMQKGHLVEEGPTDLVLEKYCI